MTIDQSISEYKTFFGEKFYNTSPYFISNNIDPDSYMTRLADRVKKPYDVYPAAFTNNAFDLSSSASRSACKAGIRRWVISSAAAMCIAVGKVSLEDCERLT